MTTELLLHFDGSDQSTLILDSGEKTRTMTPHGSAKIVTAQGKFDQSLSIDGTSGYITTPYVKSDFDWWTQDFTVECFIYANTFAGWSSMGHSVVVGNMNTSNVNYWSFGADSGGNVVFHYYTGSNRHVLSTSTLTTGAWHHIAMTQTGGNILIFVNGVLETTTAIVGTPASSESYNLTIGEYNGSIMDGYVDELRITSGTPVYTGNFTPPTAPFGGAAPSGTETVVTSLNAEVVQASTFTPDMNLTFLGTEVLASNTDTSDMKVTLLGSEIVTSVEQDLTDFSTTLLGAEVLTIGTLFANPPPPIPVLPDEGILVIARDDVNLPATAQTNKVTPTAIHKSIGYDKNEFVFAEHFNYIKNNHGVWLEYLKEVNDSIDVDISDISDKLSTATLIEGKGIIITGTLEGGTDISLDGTVMRDTGNQTMTGTNPVFDDVPFTSAAQGAAGNSLARKDWAMTEIQNSANASHYVRLVGTANEMSGLPVGETMVFFLHGMTRNGGTSYGWLNSHYIQNTSGTTLDSTNRLWVNWCDGNMSVQCALIATVPSDGKIRAFIDGDLGEVMAITAMVI